MISEKIAVVTGANKGIGYEIVKGLCKRFRGIVYLTARSVSKGEAAVNKLKSEGYNPVFHQLDITNQKSVDDFKEFIRVTHGGLDLLINNAAICYLRTATEPFSEQAENTLAVNYFGTLRMCEAIFPLLRVNARVVNVSSSAGHLSRIPTERIRNKLGSTSLTKDELNRLVYQFLSDAKDNKNEQEGWGINSYVVSKVSLTALTFIQQKNFDREIPNRNIVINAVHPGYINTDINGHNGPHTTTVGAQPPLYVALDADFKGKYVWSDSRPFDWYAETAPKNI